MKKIFLKKIVSGFAIVIVSISQAFAINQEITCPEGTVEGSHCWKCGSNCYATLTGTTINITGSGNMDTTGSTKIGDRWLTNASWRNYTIDVVNIGKDITSIGNELFDGIDIKEVNFEEGSKLKTIGHSVFPRATAQNIILPEGITDIGRWSFTGALNIYCTEAQMNGVLKNPEAIDIIGNIKQYERKENKLIVTYNGKTEIYNIDFTEQYDDMGNIIAQYDGRGNVLASYTYNDDGSVSTYDASGKLIALQGKKIFSVDEATALVSGNGKNKFTIKYR